MYFRSWDSVYSFTPASANEKQLAADSNIKIYALLLYSYEHMPHEYNCAGVCFAFGIAFIMCMYFSVRCVFACVSTQVIFACGIECLPHVAWPCCLSGHYRICSWIVSTQGFLSLQLTQKIFAVSDCLSGLPNSPAAVLLLNPACVIHHMLSWAVKGNHDKCCFSLHETTMLASHFKPPLSSCALHLQNLFCGHAAP